MLKREWGSEYRYHSRGIYGDFTGITMLPNSSVSTAKRKDVDLSLEGGGCSDFASENQVHHCGDDLGLGFTVQG